MRQRFPGFGFALSASVTLFGSYLNPYFGWRAGYARFDTDNQALLGASLGLELYKSRWFGVDVEARNYLAFGSSRGGHYMLTPALSARIAF